MNRLKESTTSAAFNSLPSLNFTPDRSVNVQVFAVASGFHEVARSPSTEPSALVRTSRLKICCSTICGPVPPPCGPPGSMLSTG